MIGFGFLTAGETPNAPDRHMKHFPITLVATCARNDSGRARLHIVASPTWDAARLLSD
jgi:hypothetical protein